MTDDMSALDIPLPITHRLHAIITAAASVVAEDLELAVIADEVSQEDAERITEAVLSAYMVLGEVETAWNSRHG